MRIDRYHSITAIVATVYCEQKAVFDSLHGDARPLDVTAKAITGTMQHLSFQLEGQASQIADKRCFIATQIYGSDARETNALRAWRDSALMTHAAGRLAITVYYAISPTIARILKGHPRASHLVRLALDRIVILLENR